MNSYIERERLDKEIETFLEIYQKLYAVAYNVTKDRFLSEETVQEAFIKVTKYRPLSDVNKCDSWLKVIVKRTAIDLLRQQNRRNLFRESEKLIDFCQMENGRTTEELVEKKLEIEDLNANLKQLDPIFQEVLFLKYVKDYTVREIAQILNLNPGTVKSRLKLAKKKLRKMKKKLKNCQTS
jgi:RNA polymerase sigma-70 factor (ECF subfamily)